MGKGILLFIVNGTIALSNVSKINAEDYVTPTNKVVMTNDSVNMRLNSNIESERIGKISKNKEVEVLITINDDWDLVRYNKIIGFVNRKYLDGLVEPNFNSNISLISGYVTALENIRLRLGPSTDYDKIGSLDSGSHVEVIGITDNNWFIVKTDNKIGFVAGEYCLYSPAIVDYDLENNKEIINEQHIYTDLYIYPTKKLNFREDPNKNSKKIIELDKGSSLKLLDFLPTGWFQVEYNGQIGYVSADYISFNNGEEYRNDIKRVVYAKSNLNLRSMPNTDSEVYYGLSRYETAEVLRYEGDWYYVRVGNMLGYIKKEYTETLNGKFVVVDISSQILTLYDNNKIILETPVVTGNQGIYDTPTGKFEIKRKEIDTYLVGPGYYTHVNYWMPFNGGIGLHDANWRSKFGGNIYVNNGSHGCVNIPSEHADDVFENVSKGTKVLVQK